MAASWERQHDRRHLRSLAKAGAQEGISGYRRAAAPHPREDRRKRFESLTERGKILSLSFFRDKAAVQAWRATSEHRQAQAKGRREIFANYRLRVANVVRDYGMHERAQVPNDSRSVHGG